MGIIRLFGRLFKWSVLAYAAMTATMLAWTFLWPQPDVRALKSADVIVCLGGGMDARGTLGAGTLTRVERCVQLFEAGLAPAVVFSGGTAGPDSPTAAHQMSLFAQSLGLPADRGIEEGRAQSTLQNALFSLDLVQDATSIIVVTEAFHLPRSWASFVWARWELGLPEKTVTLVMSEPVRKTARGEVSWRILMRESLAIWFNGARAAAYTLASNPSIDWLH